MNILAKFKETSISVLPVMAIVLLLGLTATPMSASVLVNFVVGGIFLIIGLTIFLLGVDLGIQPMGERAGAELTKKRSLSLLIFAALGIGFLVTVSEPDIQVFGSQVHSYFPIVSKNALVFIIAGGVACFLVLGLLRAVLNFSLKVTLFVSYVIVFIVAFIAPSDFFGVAFDSGGATTGPMTVPFILALGLGVTSVQAGNRESFGLTGITSIGPVFAVLVYSVLLSMTPMLIEQNQTMNEISEVTEILNESSELQIVAEKSIGESLGEFFNGFGHYAKEAAISLLPVVFLFVVFKITLFKMMTKRQTLRMVIGLVYSYVGLVLFLTGVNGGFMPAGEILGKALGIKASESTAWFILLIAVGLILGAVVVCAEPAVWVLTEQVEQASGGTIKRKTLLVFLAVGAAMAIGLALWRAVAGYSLKYILVPGYALALFLMIFSPSLFTGIAFDSGGVASGPITSSFVLSFTLGAASGTSGNSDAFGVIALVAMMPLIAIQILGIIYKNKIKNDSKNQEKIETAEVK